MSEPSAAEFRERCQSVVAQLRRALGGLITPIERRVTPGRTAGVGLAGVVAGQYLLYVDPATTITYATTLWVSVLLLTGGLLLGYGAGAA
ncbi:hypothetical protein [Haloparvum sp. PAK95]|uniref:hypothetical protein n=1 Tax=Haloparvum sp. PAK95 TaxID=3418962 RepID=UPI003D2F0550